MKLNEESRFPHPVLSIDTGDYAEGEFEILIEVSESVSRGDVTFNHTVVLTQPDLHDLVTNHGAAVGIFVNCKDTYYSELIPLGLAPGRFTFETGKLLGRVNVRPIIWTRRAITGHSLLSAHEEFGQGLTNFASGTVLGLGRESVINVGPEKLAQMDSIFTIAKADELESSTLALYLGDQKIKILVASDIYETLNRLRDLAPGKPVVLNGVYLPAVMQVLDALRDDPSQYDGLRWYRIFDAKCVHYRIDTNSPDLWTDAQKLLQSPFIEIYKAAPIFGS